MGEWSKQNRMVSKQSQSIEYDTVCPRRPVHFYTLSMLSKLDTTSRTYSTVRPKVSHVKYVLLVTII